MSDIFDLKPLDVQLLCDALRDRIAAGNLGPATERAYRDLRLRVRRLHSDRAAMLSREDMQKCAGSLRDQIHGGRLDSFTVVACEQLLERLQAVVDRGFDEFHKRNRKDHP